MSRLNSTRRAGRSTPPVFVAVAVVSALCGFTAFFAFADDAPTKTTPTESAQTPQEPKTPTDVASETIVVQETIAPKSVASETSKKIRSTLSPEDEKKFNALVDLYVYAFPLVLSNEIKRETTSNAFFATTNETAYFPKVPNARFRATELPNVDSLLAIAWLDLNKEAQIVVMPAAPREPFNVEIVDAWTNVVASFDAQSAAVDFPTLKIADRSVRAFALVGPTTPKPEKLPPGVKIVESPSDLALVWTRVFLGTSAYRGVIGARPVVRTLYEFETFPISVFLSESKLDSTIENDVRNETAPNVPAPPPTPAPNEADSAKKMGSAAPSLPLENNVQALDTEVAETLKSIESTRSNAVDSLEAEEASELNAELTPSQPLDAAVRSLADVRYAAPILVLDDEKAKKETTKTPDKDGDDQDEKAEKDNAKNSSESDEKSESNADKTLRKRFDETVERGERDFQSGAQDARRYAVDAWRDVREDGREALDGADAAYSRIARWFRDELARDGRDWNALDADFDADVRAEWERFARERRTYRPTRRWFQRPVERVEEMKPETFLKTFVELLKTNPPTAADATIVESMKTLGIVPGESLKEIDPRVRQLSRGAFPIARKEIEIAAYSQIWRNTTPTDWVVFKNLGDYGTDYLLRAAVASVFIGANSAKNAVYPFAYLDADGEPLDGDANAYRVRFPAGQTPPTEFLWSLTLYDAERYLVPNRWNKHAVRSDAPLVYNPDGSLDVVIQRDEPKENPVNWIPAPRGPFFLTLRIYQPKATVLDGTWVPPAVEKIEREKPAE